MPGAGGVVVANYLYNVAPKDGSAIALFRPARRSSRCSEIRRRNTTCTNSTGSSASTGSSTSDLLAHLAGAHDRRISSSSEMLVGSSGGGDSSTEAYARSAQSSWPGPDSRSSPATRAPATACSPWSAARSMVSSAIEFSALRAARPDWMRDNKARIVIQVGLEPIARHSGRAERARSGQGRGGPQGVRAAAGAAGVRPAVRGAAGDAAGRRRDAAAGVPGDGEGPGLPQGCRQDARPTSWSTDGDEVAALYAQDLCHAAAAGRARHRGIQARAGGR